MQESHKWICPTWIVEALIALRPPGKMRVSEWADENRILESKTSNLSGRWRTDFTPYLRDIMDAFNDPEVEEGGLVKSTQVGGTAAMINMLGYIIDRDPAPTLLLYPDEDSANETSTRVVQPMINACPALRKKFNPNSKMQLLEFDDMDVLLTGANSPNGLARNAIKNLLMDEVDKFPISAGKEANPIALAKERTRTYSGKKKIFYFSTPTYEDGPIWKFWTSADTQYEYHVRCPHCGAWWPFRFANLDYDNSSPDTAQRSAVYVCKDCGCCIDDLQRRSMIQKGEWRAIRSNGRKRIAFRLNAFCSPWLTLGEIAYEFEHSRKDPTLLMNFINSWLGEPFKDVETTINAEYLLEKQEGPFARYEIPPETILVTGGVDVQKECFYWTIRGWMSNMSSYNIAHGRAFTWQEIDHEMNQTFTDSSGKNYIVNLVCVDSGDQTDDVYNFCAIHSDWAKPVKGASSRLPGKFAASVIDKPTSKANGMLLYRVDTNYYKDMIFNRIKCDAENSGWFLHKDCDADYCEMIVSEHKVRKRYGRVLRSVWELKAEGRDNHYLDCEVYAACAADLMGLREAYAAAATEPQEPDVVGPEPQHQENPYGNPFAHNRKRWFKR